MSGKYDDILYRSRPVSEKHPPMSLHDRAAQFSPFAALTGHSAAIEETARLTEEQRQLNEEKRAELDQTWQFLMEHISEQPEITVTYFVQDEKKEGGVYITVKGHLKKIDSYRGILVLKDGTTIFYEHIASMEVSKISLQT